MKKQLLIVDGYNMIGSWPELTKLKNEDHLDIARDQLLRQLSEYQTVESIEIVVVFDAQFVPGISKSYSRYNLQVIFTDEDQTADSYIEKMAGERNNVMTQVTVATSDMAEQWTIFSRGALRVSSRDLFNELKRSDREFGQESSQYRREKNSYRRSPWQAQQLLQLEKLREKLEKEGKN